jgi:hypothetical protein
LFACVGKLFGFKFVLAHLVRIAAFPAIEGKNKITILVAALSSLGFVIAGRVTIIGGILNNTLIVQLEPLKIAFFSFIISQIFENFDLIIFEGRDYL